MTGQTHDHKILESILVFPYIWLMDVTTILFFLGMYVYGFSLMIWAVFFDKHPSRISVKASIVGLVVLTCTVFYFIYILATVGVL
jgi:hypothetical protein